MERGCRDCKDQRMFRRRVRAQWHQWDGHYSPKAQFAFYQDSPFLPSDIEVQNPSLQIHTQLRAVWPNSCCSWELVASPDLTMAPLLCHCPGLASDHNPGSWAPSCVYEAISPGKRVRMAAKESPEVWLLDRTECASMASNHSDSAFSSDLQSAWCACINSQR